MRWNARYGLGATASSDGPQRAQRRDRLLAGLDAADEAEDDRADAAQPGAQQQPAADLGGRIRHEVPIGTRHLGRPLAREGEEAAEQLRPDRLQPEVEPGHDPGAGARRLRPRRRFRRPAPPRRRPRSPPSGRARAPASRCPRPARRPRRPGRRAARRSRPARAPASPRPGPPRSPRRRRSPCATAGRSRSRRAPPGRSGCRPPPWTTRRSHRRGPRPAARARRRARARRSRPRARRSARSPPAGRRRSR